MDSVISPRRCTYTSGCRMTSRSVNPDDWYSAYPNADVTVRTYPDGGHDVQYRHLDQILLDISGQGDRILVCENGQQRMIDPSAAANSTANSIGLCAWQN